MTYSINGQAFVIPPTSGRWIEPGVVGVDGNGHSIYPSKTEFELKWNNLSPTGTFQLYEFFRSLTITGSAVVNLPRYGFAEYTFYAYSGCAVNIPIFGQYFYSQTLDVTLLITNIRYDTF